MNVQRCPNCEAPHDIGVYVTGQKVLCKCGLHFEVRRTDVSSPHVAPTRPWGPVQPTVGARSARQEKSEGITIDPMLPFDATVASTGNHAAANQPSGVEVTFVAPQPAIVLPGYELIEVLGRGGMGEVWRARQTSLGRTVAVKILPPKLAQDPEFVRRFEKEATALASLSHPNIIQIFDRGMANDHYYFAMEFVEGRSLRDVLNVGKVPPEEAVKLVVQVCRAIDYAHEMGIVHRDLKPENILVDARGHVKVADFGLAGIRGPDARLALTATSVAMGTVNYMAPEQRRDAKHVDGRADLYSMGVVLYELLTGELPIGRFKLPSERLSNVDVRLDEVVARALEADPDARYQRASAIGAELEALLGSSAGAPAQPKPPTTPARSRAPASEAALVIERGPSGLKAGLAVIGALAVIALGVRLWPSEPREAASVEPKPYPPNTYGELFAAARMSEANRHGTLEVSFEPGEEEINAHAGAWSLENGVLQAVQAGSETGEDVLKLVPRAYLAHRYFSTDHFTAEVEMQVSRLGPEYSLEPNAQQFGELAMRIKDLQISIFAIPDTGMRLGWRYFTPDGVEVTGNSARDLETMTEDETPVPKGPIRVKLSLQKKKGAVVVDAFVNGQKFAHKTLLGLEGQTGKVALGCRNSRCTFDDLTVTGEVRERPKARRAETP